MLRSMRAKNFKSWADTGDIRLAPLTGFYGANSSGKTSLLQMLLLLKQSAASSDPRQVLFLGDENSPVNLGTFQDIIHFHDIGQVFEANLILYNSTSDIPNYHPEPDELEEDDDFYLEFHAAIQQKNDRLVIKSFAYEAGEMRSPLGMELIDPETEEYLLRTSDFEPKEGKQSRLTTREKPIKFYEFPRSTSLQFRVAQYAYAGMLSNFLENGLSQLEYLGPLREHPQRTYLWAGDTPSNVGKRGERAVAALLSSRVENHSYYVELKVADWLKRMGLIDSFSLRSIAPGRRDYELVVKKTPSSAEVLITEIGFGVSQVLPVLVLCYYVPEGSTIILEQPEIHLHPSVQADLADVFIEVSKERNVQIIFESHSEYLLHRLQRRIAEEQLKRDDAALYFCDMNDDGSSRIEELRLDEYGNIANWPRDFFGDTTGDLVAMTEAEMQRKLKESE